MIGALGTTPIKLGNWLNEIGIDTQIKELQKPVLLHTALTILRKVLEIYGNLLLLNLKNINPLSEQCVT